MRSYLRIPCATSQRCKKALPGCARCTRHGKYRPTRHYQDGWKCRSQESSVVGFAPGIGRSNTSIAVARRWSAQRPPESLGWYCKACNEKYEVEQPWLHAIDCSKHGNLLMFASLEDEHWCSECESDGWLYAEKHGLLTVRKSRVVTRSTFRPEKSSNGTLQAHASFASLPRFRHTRCHWLRSC
jgi:hypothetical protein